MTSGSAVVARRVPEKLMNALRTPTSEEGSQGEAKYAKLLEIFKDRPSPKVELFIGAMEIPSGPLNVRAVLKIRPSEEDIKKFRQEVPCTGDLALFGGAKVDAVDLFDMQSVREFCNYLHAWGFRIESIEKTPLESWPSELRLTVVV